MGTFNSGVTAYAQQVRALNLVWALVETGTVQCRRPKGDNEVKSIAIVGGGFAGLTVAAALLKKEVAGRITIFERCDTLLPLQNGSDSRWLHPRIYDWPSEESEASAAMLPVLNWSAARASDVAVQLLSEWRSLVDPQNHKQSDPDFALPEVYCNTKHLQVRDEAESGGHFAIEWVGEKRTAAGEAMPEALGPNGETAPFDIVVLTLGFGLERDDTNSYWRNDNLSQPSLDRPRSTYLVSGQGDGAVIDLLRLRVSEFRQDRILSELFDRAPRLRAELKLLHAESANAGRENWYGKFESMSGRLPDEFARVKAALTKRLRRDTEAIFHIKATNIDELFRSNGGRISFQNRFLLYLLYRCGGFVPSTQPEHQLVQQYGISKDCIVRRHGTDREAQLASALHLSLFKAPSRGAKTKLPMQNPEIFWNGGYFGFPGSLKTAVLLPNELKKEWRREYLPGPTNLVGASLCLSLRSLLTERKTEDGRLRITLHRATVIGGQEVLQQCCDYVGYNDPFAARSAGRTFPADIGTIGVAYETRRIVRSKRGIAPESLREVMGTLKLEKGASDMDSHVRFLLAVPILEPASSGQFTRPTPVAGVLYVDSTSPNFFVEDAELRSVVHCINHVVGSLAQQAAGYARIRNIMLAPGKDVPPTVSLTPKAAVALDLVSIDPPATGAPFQFNFDHSDFLVSQ